MTAFPVHHQLLELTQTHIHRVSDAIQPSHPYLSETEVAQLCLTLCDPMDCRMSDFPVHYQLLEPTQAHVHRVSDAIQPSHPLSSPSPLAFNLFQHQGLFPDVKSQLFTSGGQSTGVSASTSVLPVNIQG